MRKNWLTETPVYFGKTFMCRKVKICILEFLKGLIDHGVIVYHPHWTDEESWSQNCWGDSSKNSWLKQCSGCSSHPGMSDCTVGSLPTAESHCSLSSLGWKSTETIYNHRNKTYQWLRTEPREKAITIHLFFLKPELSWSWILKTKFSWLYLNMLRKAIMNYFPLRHLFGVWSILLLQQRYLIKQLGEGRLCSGLQSNDPSMVGMPRTGGHGSHRFYSMEAQYCEFIFNWLLTFYATQDTSL